MKIRILVFAVVTLTTAFVLTNCSKKDQVTQPESKTNATLTNPMDLALAKRIADFRQQIDKLRKSPDLKSNETMTIEDARWNIETLFNATYGFPDEVYCSTRHDSAILYLTVGDDGLVNVDDVAVNYDDCIDQVLDFYHNSGFTNKGFLFLTVKAGQVVNGSVGLKLNVVTGEKLPSLPAWTPFGYGDNWKYGEMLGKCDGSFFNESDGAKQIEVQINMRRPVIHVTPPQRIIYIMDPMSPYKLDGHEFKNSFNENLIFYYESPTPITDEERCLSYAKMNFHYFGEDEVIYDRMPAAYNRSANWTFMNCYIEGVSDYISLANLFRIRHTNYLTYAYISPVPIDQVALPVSIETEE